MPVSLFTLLRRSWLCFFTLTALAQAPTPPQVITVGAGKQQRLWLGVLTRSTVYLRISNANGNCINVFWQHAGFIRTSNQRICSVAALSTYSPLASLWANRPEATTVVALSDDAKGLADPAWLCRLGFLCPK